MKALTYLDLRNQARLRQWQQRKIAAEPAARVTLDCAVQYEVPLTWLTTPTFLRRQSSAWAEPMPMMLRGQAE